MKQQEEQFHIGLSVEQGARYAILPGDPGRVERIASCLKQPQFEGRNREYHTWSGTLAGERVLVTSTGIGGPSAAIAVEELYQIGVRTIIRVGTCGGMSLAVKAGEAVIPTAAVRVEGTSKEYIAPEFPAAADFSVVSSLAEAAKEQGVPHHIGIVQSKDSFYGQHSPDRMPVGEQLMADWEMWRKAGCLASEMECATIFIVSAVLGMKAGAVLHTIWNQEREKAGLSNGTEKDMENAINLAILSMQKLIKK